MAQLVEAIELRDFNFRLFEGPVWIGDGLYFSDISTGGGWNSTIVKYTPAANTAVDFLVDAGSNGLAVDAQGVLHSATAKKGEISIYDLNAKTQSTAFGGMLNSPNDLAIASDGTLYFSDPQQGELMPGGQPQVVHVVKGGVDAALLTMEEAPGPNGVTLSPDESVLYVAGGGFTGYVKRVQLQGGLSAGVEDLVTGLTVPDGMTKDCAGNLYVAEHENQRVAVFSPEGTEIASIKTGAAANGQSARTTNVAFGGADGKTLFITAVYSLWQIPLDIAGYPY